MTTEELKVKVSLDTSGLKQDINRAKKSLDDLNSQTTKAMTGVNSGAGATSESMAELKSQMEAVASLQFADLFIDNFDKIKAATTNLTKWIKLDFSDLKSHIGALGILIRERDWGSAKLAFKDIFEQIGIGAHNALVGVKQLWGTIAGVAKVVSAVALVAAAFFTLKNAIVRAQEVTKSAFSAEKIGMTTDAFGEWGYVVTQLGGELDDLTDYVRTLSAAQNDVRNGTEEWVAAFEKLGMSQEEVSNMSQSEMFARTIMGLQNLESEVERVSLAYKIFGEDDGAKVTTLLHTNSAEIERMIHNYHMLGGVMSGELINNSKILTGSLNNLRAAWTGLKNTLAEVFLPIIIPVVQWLVRAVAVVNMFIRAIFGRDIVVASSGIADVANTYDGYTDSANTATNATNKVTEAVERLKRVTMGFDELNKLPGVDPTSSSTGGDTGNSGVSQLPTGGMSGGLDLPTTEDLGLDGIAEWIDKNKQKIADISALLLTLGGIALAVFCFLHGNIVGGIAGLALAGIGIVAGTQDGGIWDRLFDGIKGVWESVKTWFSQHVAPVFTKDYWVKKWNSIKDGAAEMWEKFKDSAFAKWFGGLKDKAVSLTATFKEVGSNIRTAVLNAWDKLKNKTAELKSKFTDGYSTTRQRLAGAWDKIKTKTSTLTGKFKRTGYYQTLSNYWDKFKTKTSTLTVAFKDAFTSKIKAAWNGLVKAINSAITTINKIPKVNIPKLPYLATGGITTGPTTAVIGEAGREAVLPLENNTGWMDALADKIAARGGNNNAPTKIVLTVDGKQLGWATIDNINSITKQTGSLPLQLV